MVDLSGASIGIGAVVSLLSGVIGALSVWFKLKGLVNVMQVRIKNLEAEKEKDLTYHKESISQLHKRIDAVKVIVERNREKSDKGIQEIKLDIKSMEMRILKAIHNIKDSE